MGCSSNFELNLRDSDIQKGPLAELLYSTTTNLNNQFEQKDSPLLEKKGYSFYHRFFFWRETGGARTYCVLTPRFLLLPCMLGRARERKQDKQSPVIFYCKNQMRRTRGISGCTDTEEQNRRQQPHKASERPRNLKVESAIK